MLTNFKQVLLGSMASAAVLLTGTDPAVAVSFDISGIFGGGIVDAATGALIYRTPQGRVDAQAVYDQATGLLQMDGSISLATVTRPNETLDRGNISIAFSIFYEAFDYTAPDPLHGGTQQVVVSTEQGNGGAGAIINLQVDGISQSNAVALASMGADLSNHPEYAPVNLLGTPLHLVLADLLGGPTWNGDNSAKSWLVFGPFMLGGQLVKLSGDLHANYTGGFSTEVPEPSSMLLLGMGVLGGMQARKRRAASRHDAA